MGSSSWSASVSVVVPSRNEGISLRQTVHGLLGTLPQDAEIVVVDDASEDGSADFLASGYPSVRLVDCASRVGSAVARNRGAAVARGDVIVFCDAHVVCPFGWVEPLLEALRDPGVGAAGPATSVLGSPANVGFGLTFRNEALDVTWLPWRAQEPYEVPILGGAFLAVTRAALEDAGGFDDGIVNWGTEDCELSLRLWLLGLRLLVVPGVTVAHRFRSRLPYQLERGALTHNKLRLATTHLGPERLERVLAAVAGDPELPAALARLLAGDAPERRAAMARSRVHDDDWYFERFGEPARPARKGAST
jgi:GT2 family glycosyltransferase